MGFKFVRWGGVVPEGGLRCSLHISAPVLLPPATYG